MNPPFVKVITLSFLLELLVCEDSTICHRKLDMLEDWTVG